VAFEVDDLQAAIEQIPRPKSGGGGIRTLGGP
jgi:hypothetical protein